jgi:flavodoxin
MKNTRVLVVYYSRAGKTKDLAEELANRLGCDVEAVIDKRKRTGPLHFLSSGRDAQKMVLTEIEKPGKNPSDYDLVIIGTPVFSGRVSASIRTYLVMNKDKMRHVAFFQTHMFNKNRAFEDMGAILSRTPIACLEVKKKDLRTGTYDRKIKGFIERIVAECQNTPSAAIAQQQDMPGLAEAHVKADKHSTAVHSITASGMVRCASGEP